jgi:hypothetical protein
MKRNTASNFKFVVAGESSVLDWREAGLVFIFHFCSILDISQTMIGRNIDVARGLLGQGQIGRQETPVRAHG